MILHDSDPPHVFNLLELLFPCFPIVIIGPIVSIYIVVLFHVMLFTEYISVIRGNFLT